MSHVRRIFLALLLFILAGWLYKQWRTRQPNEGLFDLLDKKPDSTAPSSTSTPATPPSLPTPPNRTATPALSRLDEEISALAQRTLPCVVSIDTQNLQKERLNSLFSRLEVVPSLGSGVIITKEGHILTNHHVIANALEIRVTTNDQKSYKAEFIGTNPKADIAVIKIVDADHNFPVLKFANSDQVRVGQTVFAVGNPFGLSGSFTQGIISARRNSAQTGNIFQTDTVINPGNSGGPLVDIHGEIVGINFSIRSGNSQVNTWQGVGFAIPANEARVAFDTIIKEKTVPTGFLGITMDEVVIEVSPGRIGVTINEVVPQSSAANAGLRPDDVIIGLNGDPLEHPDEVYIVASATPIGRSIVFDILRNQQRRTITATMQPRPQD
ncbi:trypsin-like serine protease [Phragmitibacter flavus]|uniref:Trypsin-like serine protease n=1 Tax=Phragmitibacter flavus TaxID=2576071 RepID=A0A5R8KE78_9BACT|nr:trypsin-like peptidase domain-containing protein [Phragmitibacter flavus]TLD70591.1 trypsin-like serine protease [Phragmitibacter flavus]